MKKIKFRENLAQFGDSRSEANTEKLQICLISYKCRKIQISAQKIAKKMHFWGNCYKFIATSHDETLIFEVYIEKGCQKSSTMSISGKFQEIFKLKFVIKVEIHQKAGLGTY